MALTIGSFDLETIRAFLDTANFNILNLPTKAADLFATYPLEFWTCHFGYAQIIVQQRFVHQSLVLTKNRDCRIVLGKKERCTQSARSVAYYDYIWHFILIYKAVGYIIDAKLAKPVFYCQLASGRQGSVAAPLGLSASGRMGGVSYEVYATSR